MPKTKQVAITMSQELYNQIKTISLDQNRSVSGQIRFMLSCTLEKASTDPNFHKRIYGYYPK